MSAELLDGLRALAREHGTVQLVEACSEFVRHFAAKGVRAELAERSDTDEDCPRCRERKALLEETKSRIRGGAPQGGRGDSEEGAAA